jgi:hypothetical protein
MATTQMFSKRLEHDGHVHRFLIASHGPEGWEVREERDSTVVRQTHYTDWHRVERARSIMALRATLLEQNGWTEA